MYILQLFYTYQDLSHFNQSLSKNDIVMLTTDDSMTEWSVQEENRFNFCTQWSSIPLIRVTGAAGIYRAPSQETIYTKGQYPVNPLCTVLFFGFLSE